MRIVSNKIFTGKAKNFDDFIKEASSKNQQNIKTASVNEEETVVSSNVSASEDVKVSYKASSEVKNSVVQTANEVVAECGCSKKEEMKEEKKEEPKAEKKEEKNEEKKEVKESCSVASASTENKDVNKQAENNTVIKQGVDWGKLRPVANLTKEQKSKVYNYWRNIYGEAYASAMVQDR